MAIIDKPTDYFNTKIYTGNSSSQTLSMANIGLAWFKSRSDTGGQLLFDIMRGGNGTNSQEPILKTNSTVKDQGSDITAAGGLVFGSSSTSVGTDNGGYNYNQNGKSYVNWHWQAGTSFTNDASATGIGTIDSAGNFNNTSGFSVVLYTGTGSNGTVKHGLNSTPSMIMFKRTDSSGAWPTWHVSLGTNIMEINSYGASQSGSSYTNSTAPTSSVFSIGTSGDINANGGIYIAYCFSEKESYSKFSHYIGNGSASNGTFIYTGFKPAFVILKNATQSGKWLMMDDKRPTAAPGNPNNARLFAGDSNAESTANNMINLLSNGFKLTTSDSDHNASGDTNIYMAFAENPFVTSTDNGSIPATAR